jgi:hypothetical protein
MTMKTPLERILAAYRPLYLRGLLLDGQYRLPATRAAEVPAANATHPQRRHPRKPLAALSQRLFVPLDRS